MEHTARHTWVPWVAALAGTAYVLKVALILATSNDAGDGATAALYLGGLALGLAAAVGAGLRQRSAAKGVAVGFGCAVLLVAWVMGLGEVLEPVVGAFSEREYVREEVPIGVTGVVLLALAWFGRTRDLRPA